MKKSSGPSWWKMFRNQRAAIESVSDADAGSGLKAAFKYFDGEEVGTLTQGAFTVLCVIRPYMDEAMSDYEDAVASGKRGAAERWGKS